MDHEEIASSWIGDAATTRGEVRRQIRSDDAPLIASQNNGHIFSKISLLTPLTEIYELANFRMPSHSGRRTFGTCLNEGVAFYFIRLATTVMSLFASLNCCAGFDDLCSWNLSFETLLVRFRFHRYSDNGTGR